MSAPINTLVPLRVLILEDNPSDAELVLHQLRISGFDPVAAVMCTEDTFRLHLTDTVDIILSDYSMPQFDAPAALRILRSSPYDIPFIVISGTIGEDSAVAVMRDGASDYLLKDRLSRLGVAVENAIAQRDLRRHAKETEETLRKMIRAVEQSADCIVMTDRNGLIEYVNPAFLNKTGYERGEVIGKKTSMLKSGIHDNRFYARLWETITAGRVFRAEFTNKKKNGEIYSEFQGISPVYDDSGVIINYVSTGTDLTELHRMEDALRQSEQRYASLVESALDAIFTLSNDGTFMTLNPAFEKITGWKRSAWFRRRFNELLHEDDQAAAMAKFVRMLNGENIPVSEYRISTASGTYVVVEVLTVPMYDGSDIVGIYGIARDVTERKRLEEQFRQAQKMESIGTLAGGIAHDFNNILGIILAGATLLERLEPGSPSFAANLKMIDGSVKRGATLVRQILTFARKDEPQFAAMQMNDLLAELKKMLDLTIPKTIAIELDLYEHLPYIIADSNQVHQALLNLCVNARDAIIGKEQGGVHTGTITITTGIIRRAEDAELFSRTEADECIIVRISDTGMGMDEETVQRIFDPFFTTKEKGKGTGLGLAVVYGVMQSVNGAVRVASTPGVGSTFSLFFPAATDHRPAEENHTSDPLQIRGGSETILLVEDEESLRVMTAVILETKGYTVITAESGPDGWERFTSSKERIDLVFSDYGLPGLDGFTLLNRIRESNPAVRTILTSGYLEPDQRAEILASGVNDILQKPYEYSHILTAVRQVLDARDSGRQQ